MKSATTGTLVDGVLKLDEPIDLPNHSRVNVSIEPIASPSEQARVALESFLKRADERAFNSGGLRFTRDQLHERH